MINSLDADTYTPRQLSISKDIADRFNLRSRQEVYVELVTGYFAA